MADLFSGCLVFPFLRKQRLVQKEILVYVGRVTEQVSVDIDADPIVYAYPGWRKAEPILLYISNQSYFQSKSN